MNTRAHQPLHLLSRTEFLWRQLRYAGAALGFMLLSLGMGMLGYHLLAHIDWIDSLAQCEHDSERYGARCQFAWYLRETFRQRLRLVLRGGLPGGICSAFIPIGGTTYENPAPPGTSYTVSATGKTPPGTLGRRVITGRCRPAHKEPRHTIKGAPSQCAVLPG